MTRSPFYFRIGIFIAALILGSRLLPKDPLSTPLPDGPRDLAKVEGALDKLNLDERDLVVGYIERSNGQVLPAQFADPEYPFTARTFGEAIKLQREFLAKRAAVQAAVDARNKGRQELLAPLREVLSVELAKKEIVSRQDFLYRGLPAGPPNKPVNDPRVLVTTWRVRNRSSEQIARFNGSATVRLAGEASALTGLADCWLDQRSPLEPGAEREVACGNLEQPATRADEEYVALPERSTVVTWEPHEIEFAGGRKLTVPE